MKIYFHDFEDQPCRYFLDKDTAIASLENDFSEYDSDNNYPKNLRGYSGTWVLENGKASFDYWGDIIEQILAENTKSIKESREEERELSSPYLTGRI